MTDLRDTLINARVVLLDFDGPICSIFAGYPAPQVAERLRDHLRARGWHEDQVPRSDDPMIVWSEVAQRSAEAGSQVEPMLRATEVEAAATARPTPGAAELLVACRNAHRRVAIVSNNGADAIVRYLAREKLTDLVQHVEGRDSSDPAFMKPNPRSLHRAIQALAVSPQGCIFVGDSESDAVAACTAAVPFIGYANRPEKEARLRQAGARHVVTSVHTLAHAIATRLPD